MNHFAFVDLRDRYGITQAHQEKQPTVVFQQMGVGFNGGKGGLKGGGLGRIQSAAPFFCSPVHFLCDKKHLKQSKVDVSYTPRDLREHTKKQPLPIVYNKGSWRWNEGWPLKTSVFLGPGSGCVMQQTTTWIPRRPIFQHSRCWLLVAVFFCQVVFPKDDADEAALERYQMAKSMGREYVVKATLMWAEALYSSPSIQPTVLSETKEDSFESFGFQVCIHIIHTHCQCNLSLSWIHDFSFFFFFEKFHYKSFATTGHWQGATRGWWDWYLVPY